MHHWEKERMDLKTDVQRNWIYQKWLIARCWNNHDDDDDDVKGHAWQKSILLFDHMVIMWLQRNRMKELEFDNLFIGMCNNHLFVWDRI